MPSTTTQTSLPTGWVEGTTPDEKPMVYIEGLDRDTLSAQYAAIRQWADENGYQLEPAGYDLLNYNSWVDLYTWVGFTYEATSDHNNDRYFSQYLCPGCNTETAPGTAVCPTCGHLEGCYGCSVFGLALYTEVSQDGKGYCGKCSQACTSCSGFLPAGNFTKCVNCDPRVSCRGCNQTFSQSDTVENSGSRYCQTCATNFCDECNAYDPRRARLTVDGTARRLCQPCAQKVYDAERAQFEAWSLEELPVSGTLLVPSSSSRPIRTISIETEFDGDGPAVTRALHSAGLLPSPHMDGSHLAEPNNTTHPCLMKRDGTVSGGELVTYLLSMDNENHAAALLRMTEVMRGCREMNHARFSRNAGGHIHIDLHGYTMKNIWALDAIFRYLERALYYIAGAGADYGHRSLEGNSYGSPSGSDKIFKSVRDFALNFDANRNGLNLGNWSATRRNCGCGAFQAGEWNECTCNLGKATAEWRLWNSEITPRILHAWIAIMQSVTAHAQNISEDFNPEKLPPLKWETRRLEKTAKASVTAIKERLEWMHRELPLTIHERDSIIYASKRSELNVLGDKYLDELLEIANVSPMGSSKKKAPNPLARKTKFKLKNVSKRTKLTDSDIEALVAQGWEITDATEAD